MSSLNIEYNGASIPIANIGVVSSKQKVILGNLLRDLVLQTAGSISILVGNRYYDLSFSSNGLSNTITSNVNFINSILGTSFSNYEDGAFVFASDSKSLYIIYSGQAILLAGGGDSNKMFLSFSEDQELTGDQKKQLLSNTESIVNSIDDVKKFTKNKVYDGYIIFVNDENQHYILSDINNPELKLSWSTFYIGQNGGIINNGLVIKNKTRENLLYLNGIDDYNSLIFNGLKIGNDNSNIKISVTNDDISLLKTNSKYFKLYNNSNLILSSNNGNIGIGGNSSGSDKYKILFTGNAKFDDYIYADNRILSSDYTSTNVTHWDGGKGFALIKDTSGNWFMEVDDLIVRNSLTANLLILKELKVERTYATGGHMIVTDGSIVDTMYLRKPTAEELNTANVANKGSFGTLDSDLYYYFVTFKNSKDKDDNDAYVSLDSNPQDKSINGSTVLDDVLNENSVCPFIYDDILLCLNVLGINAKRYYCKVSYSTNNYIAIKESDFRNNKIYQHDSNGDPISILKEYLIEKGDELVRITNISTKSDGTYKYDDRRRFIDIDGTRNLITMYDKMGDKNLFSIDNLVTTDNGFKYYPNINVVTGIKDGENQGALKLRIGKLDDLGIDGLAGYGLYADNVYLKGKLIIKNDNVETVVGANRGTWLPDNTNTYYINDLVTFGGSVYRCITKHTTTLESKAPGVSNFWEIFVKKGEDGKAETNFRYVDISGEQVFVYDLETNTYDKSSISLTCTAFNVDYDKLINIKFEWRVGNTTIYTKTYYKADISSGTISDSINVYPKDLNESINWNSFWLDNKSISLKCLVYTNDSETYDSDVFSVYKVTNGDNAELISITGNQVFKYPNKDALKPTIENILLTASIQNTTGYLWKYYNGTTWIDFPNNNSSSTYNLYYNDSAWSSNTLRIRCESGSVYDEITIIKVYDGDDSLNVILTNEYQGLACTEDGNLKAGELSKAITAVKVYKGSTEIPYNALTGWQYNTAPIPDGCTLNTVDSEVISLASISSMSATVDIPVKYESFTTSRTFSINKVLDGNSAYTVSLTNLALTIPCLANGSFPSNIFTVNEYSSDVVVYKGDKKLIYGDLTTGNYSYLVLFSDLPFGSTNRVKLIDSSILGGDFTLRINDLYLTEAEYETMDSFSTNITINILYNGLLVVPNVSFTKTLSISKAKQGPLLDWIKEWDGASTLIDGTKVISPRIFAGSKDNTTGTYTGVAIGRNAFGLTENGVAGYYNSQKTFHLNTNGDVIIGAKDNNILYKEKTYQKNANYISFTLENGLEISSTAKFRDPNYSYTLSEYVSNKTATIYTDDYVITTKDKSTFAPVGVKDKDLWYPKSFDEASKSCNGYFFIYDSTQVGDKWVVAGDNTLTTINGGIIASGTIKLGSGGSVNSGITGLTDIGDTNPVRFWAGNTFENRNIAKFKVHENGLLEIGNTNSTYSLNTNGLLSTGSGLILYTDESGIGGLATKKFAVTTSGEVFIDGSILITNVLDSGSSSLKDLLTYFSLKTIDGKTYLSTIYSIVSEGGISALGANLGSGGGTSGLDYSALKTLLTGSENSYVINTAFLGDINKDYIVSSLDGYYSLAAHSHNMSDLTNNAGYVVTTDSRLTNARYNPYALTFTGYLSAVYDGSNSVSIALPTKLSQFTNDIGAGTSITKAQVEAVLTGTITTHTHNYLTGDQTISVTGDATGSGTTAITLTLANSGVTAGTYRSVTVDAKGRVTAGTNPATLAGYGITDAAPSSHVGATGSAHGIVTTSVNGFMSSTDKTKLDGIATGANNYTHPTSGIIAGTYKSVTVDSNGHITSGTNPTTLAGYGIVDALSSIGGTISGILNIKGTVFSSGNLYVGDNRTGLADGLAGVALNKSGGIEISGGNPLIDFHFNNAATDYTSRIIEMFSGQLGFDCAVRIGDVATSNVISDKAYKFAVVGDSNFVGSITATKTILGTWTMEETSDELVIKKSGTIVGRFTSAGFVSAGGVTALN